MKNEIRILLTLLLVFLGIIAAFYKGHFKFNQPPRPAESQESPVLGIDVSSHQKEIKWREIDPKQVQFVYIKATEGSKFKDKKFLSNWNEARKYAFPTGAYHFFSFCKSAKEQAKNFIETVPYKPNALPPVLDLEDEANCKSGKTKEAIVAEIETLQQILFNKYQKKPILYMTEEFYYIYSMAQFKENPLWISAFYQEPNLQNGKWLFWQYSYKGFIKGIDTNVDLNVFNGTAADFGKFIKQN